jgi:hypothetical protein
MAGRAPGESAAVGPMHPLGRVAPHPAWAAEEDIGVAGRMLRLSPRVVVENVEVILVLVAVIVIAIATVSGTAMEDGLGMGIGVRRFLGENRRLREHRGVTGIGHRGTDGRRRGRLGRVRVRQRRGGVGR